jgi:hypothetical protein
LLWWLSLARAKIRGHGPSEISYTNWNLPSTPTSIDYPEFSSLFFAAFISLLFKVSPFYSYFLSKNCGGLLVLVVMFFEGIRLITILARYVISKLSKLRERVILGVDRDHGTCNGRQVLDLEVLSNYLD